MCFQVKFYFSLRLELNDVFTDVSTPEVSDSEPEESHSAAVVDNSQPSTSGGAGVLADNFAQQKSKMFQINTWPSPDTSYVGLYACAKYRRNVRRKMQKIRKLLQNESFEAATKTFAYRMELGRIHEIYPENGNRPYLNQLIGNFFI